VFKGEIAS